MLCRGIASSLSTGEDHCWSWYRGEKQHGWRQGNSYILGLQPSFLGPGLGAPFTPLSIHMYWEQACACSGKDSLGGSTFLLTLLVPHSSRCIVWCGTTLPVFRGQAAWCRAAPATTKVPWGGRFWHSLIVALCTVPAMWVALIALCSRCPDVPCSWPCAAAHGVPRFSKSSSLGVR